MSRLLGVSYLLVQTSLRRPDGMGPSTCPCKTPGSMSGLGDGGQHEYPAGRRDLLLAQLAQPGAAHPPRPQAVTECTWKAHSFSVLCSTLYFPVFASCSGGIRAALQPILAVWWPPEHLSTGGTYRFPGPAQTLPEKHARGGPGSQGGKCGAWAPSPCQNQSLALCLCATSGPGPTLGNTVPTGPRPLQGSPCACLLRVVLCSARWGWWHFSCEPLEI